MSFNILPKTLKKKTTFEPNRYNIYCTSTCLQWMRGGIIHCIYMLLQSDYSWGFRET